ncbi:Ankyrin repeat-containing domain protein [Raphanus sativus]|nr:Ankyrin repeat-containing domain protein [Raphanus sativus]
MAMQIATPAPAPITAPEINIILTPAKTETHKKNRIQVSNTKKPLFFYVNLAKRYIQQHNEVELSALGMAITTVVTISEILKNNGLATEKKVLTSTVGMKDETKGKMIEIVLGKSDKFDSLVPPVTNGKTPEEVAKAETEAAVEAQEAAATQRWHCFHIQLCDTAFYNTGLYKKLNLRLLSLQENLLCISFLADFDKVTPHKNNVLHIAAKHQRLDFAAAILELRPCLLLGENNNGDTPLHVAASVGSFQVLQLLVNSAINNVSSDIENRGITKQLLRTTNKQNDTALHVALKNGNVDVAKLLFEQDTGLLEMANNNNESPLYLAIERGLFDIADHIWQHLLLFPVQGLKV